MKIKILFLVLACMILSFNKSHAQIDYNENGLSDIWEKLFDINSDAKADDDKDGIPNDLECMAGTNPKDAGSCLEVHKALWDPNSKSIVLEWHSLNGKDYQFLYSDNLIGGPGDWKFIASYQQRSPDAYVEINLKDSDEINISEAKHIFIRIVSSDRDEDEDGITAWEENIISTSDQSADDSDYVKVREFLGIEDDEGDDGNEDGDDPDSEDDPNEDNDEGMDPEGEPDEDNETFDAEEALIILSEILLEGELEELDTELLSTQQLATFEALVQTLGNFNSEEEVYAYYETLSDEDRNTILAIFTALEGDEDAEGDDGNEDGDDPDSEDDPNEDNDVGTDPEGEPDEDNETFDAEEALIILWEILLEGELEELDTELLSTQQLTTFETLVQTLGNFNSEEEVYAYYETLSDEDRNTILAIFTALEGDGNEDGDDPDSEDDPNENNVNIEAEDVIFALWEIVLEGETAEISNELSENLRPSFEQFISEISALSSEDQIEGYLNSLNDNKLAELNELSKVLFEEDGEGDGNGEADDDVDDERIKPGNASGIQPPQVAPIPDNGTVNISLEESSRFLAQSTLGADMETIDAVSRAGFEAWIDYQFALPPGYHLEANIATRIKEDDFIESPYRWAWWEQAMKAPDQLRQRVAFALSEIFVVSDITDALEDHQWGLADYYDVLIDGSFGNFRDLLTQVTYHPVMGHYLSHVKNRKAVPELNQFPDENYAREIMQLFTIGLYELNGDGSVKKDSNGRPIDTYNNSDIRELARVFTGLTYNPAPPIEKIPYDPGDIGSTTITTEFDFLAVEPIYFVGQMAKFEPLHDTEPKTFLGNTIPGGAIDEDIRNTLDVIFNHPNVGPFISHRLIQRLITSNPSPEYIASVANVFNDNGSGVRGDMKAVIKAILLHPEARSDRPASDIHFGKLKEPYLRYTQLCRAFNARTSSGAYRNFGSPASEAMRQKPLGAPSVFNFFLPDYQPLGDIQLAGLVAPEFQILTSTTSVATINFWGDALVDEQLMDLGDEDFVPASLDLSDELALLPNVSALIDRLNIILAHGSLSPESASIIKSAVEQGMPQFEGDEAVKFAIYLILNSPDYAVLR